MYNRKAIKLRSKAAFKANYWKTVLVSFIFTFIVGGTASSVGSNAAKGFSGGSTAPAAGVYGAQNQMDQLLSGDPQAAAIALAVILGALGIAIALGAAINIFLVEPIKIGAYSFYDKNEKAPAELGEICAGFKTGYMRNVLAMFLVRLFTAIGSLLFVIPGILFSYGFRLVPYILAENSDLTAMEALKESHRLMKGNRWKLFVLELSFIGWNFLTALTLGLLGIFFVIPYEEQSKAGFYEAIKKIAAGIDPEAQEEIFVEEKEA